MLTMRQFIERKNVERFLGCLSTETNPVKRIILLKLLSEERAQSQITLESQGRSPA
jgi:hypothetical protein